MLQADDSGTDVDLFKFSFYKIWLYITNVSQYS